MTPISRAWFVAFLVLVFAIGSFSGVLVDRVWLLRHPGAFAGGPDLPPGPDPVPALGGRRGRGADRVVDAQLTWLDRRLDLTADQRREIAAILQAWQERAAALQVETRRRFVDEQAALRAEIEAALTPEQVERFRQARGGPLRRGGPLDPGRRRGRGPEPPGPE